MQIEVDKVNTGNMLRKDMGDLNSLAESIKDKGLINPIVIDSKGNLRRGLRRLSAFKLLGKSKIPCIKVSGETKLGDRVLDFIENVQRQELSWQEKSKFINQVHTSLKAASPKWSTDMTAAILHISPGFVREMLTVAKAPKEILNQAHNKNSVREAFRFVNRAKREKLVSNAIASMDISNIATFYNGNCVDILPKIESNSLDIVYTDPPYGVSLDKNKSFKGVYDKEDTFNSWYDLIEKILPEFYRILEEGGWLLMWGAISNGSYIRELFKKFNFNMLVKPLIVAYSQGLTPAPKYVLGSSTDFLWAAYKGKHRGFVTQGLMDSLYTTKIPTDDKEYALEKSPNITEYWLPAFINPGKSKVLDAFCGVGSLVTPLIKLGVSKLICIEENKSRFELLNKNMRLAILEYEGSK